MSQAKHGKQRQSSEENSDSQSRRDAAPTASAASVQHACRHWVCLRFSAECRGFSCSSCGTCLRHRPRGEAHAGSAGTGTLQRPGEGIRALRRLLLPYGVVHSSRRIICHKGCAMPLSIAAGGSTRLNAGRQAVASLACEAYQVDAQRDGIDPSMPLPAMLCIR